MFAGVLGAFFSVIRQRPPRTTKGCSSAASDVYRRLQRTTVPAMPALTRKVDPKEIRIDSSPESIRSSAHSADTIYSSPIVETVKSSPQFVPGSPTVLSVASSPLYVNSSAHTVHSSTQSSIQAVTPMYYVPMANPPVGLVTPDARSAMASPPDATAPPTTACTRQT